MKLYAMALAIVLSGAASLPAQRPQARAKQTKGQKAKTNDQTPNAKKQKPEVKRGKLEAKQQKITVRGFKGDTVAIFQGAVVLERNVRAHLEFLASDALQGRGSGTRDEHLAARYIAAQLRQFGIEPAGDAGDYVQTVTIGARQSFAAPPTLSFANTTWTHGQEIAALRLSRGSISGPLQKLAGDGAPDKGAIVYATLPEGLSQREYNQRVSSLSRQGAAAVLLPAPPEMQQNWAGVSSQLPGFTVTSEDLSGNAGGPPANFNVIFLAPNAAQSLAQVADGTILSVGGKLNEAERRQTWNAVGVLPGTDPDGDAIILSAHLDHLGFRPNAPGDDKIYNGADDDASGCVAVLELARALGAGPPPKRNVYFVFFGSEESGGFGARYFLKHSPVPLEKIAANLEFEMIGRADDKVKPEELWLTGYERSNLGPELAKQGAQLVADPHPEENFFQRSDNYALARLGVVAHTVSSFGLHREYHQTNDDLAHIDFSHLTRSVNAMIAPVQWLANSDFKPVWNAGKRP